MEIELIRGKASTTGVRVADFHRDKGEAGNAKRKDLYLIAA